MLRKNSKRIKNGDIFVAIGDGINYVDEAIKNGASSVVSEVKLDNVEALIVDDALKYYQDYIYNTYYNEIKDIKLVGITGTNGKTTTAYLVYQMLNSLGVKTGYIGTIGFYYGDKYKELSRTTPDIEDLYEMLLTCKEEGITHVVMEVSSHALKQNRVYGLKYDTSVFTNFTQDHLDYHVTMEDYLESKIKLFNLLKEDGTAIINSDDPSYKSFVLDKNKNVLIGFNGDVKINNIDLHHNGTDISFNYNGDYFKSINMVGKFNVYNYLEAVLAVNSLGFDINDCLKLDVAPPPGRMQLIKYNSNAIFVDYAHTPDAMENVLKCVNELKCGKVITVFGCGGNRDSSKRHIMGSISTEMSDYVIITDDNPRFEDGEAIISDIVSGISKDNYEVVSDRKEAIRRAIELLSENDILMILGKGHEDYQIIGDVKYHFDDREVVRNLINK